MQTQAKNVHHGKFGFYPCDWQTFQKLRRLYGYYLLALSRNADWARWNRKQPQNRVLRKWYRDAQGRRTGFEIVGPRTEPQLVPIFTEKAKHKNWRGDSLWDEVKILNSHIEQNYRRAKYPAASEAEVQPLTISIAEIDNMLAILDKWKSEQS